MKMKKCPRCGSTRLAPILYGYPLFDDELQKKLEEEKLALGGCCITGCDPKYHCFECDSDVGTPPVLLSEQGKADYREIVTALHFQYGGFFSGSKEMEIKDTGESIQLEVSPGFYTANAGLKRELGRDEWDKLLNRLFCTLYIHEWEKEFINENLVLDGEEWELSLKLAGYQELFYSGSNAYPP